VVEMGECDSFVDCADDVGAIVPGSESDNSGPRCGVGHRSPQVGVEGDARRTDRSRGEDLVEDRVDVGPAPLGFLALGETELV
jgi:hypothetical protein